MCSAIRASRYKEERLIYCQASLINAASAPALSLRAKLPRMRARTNTRACICERAFSASLLSLSFCHKEHVNPEENRTRIEFRTSGTFSRFRARDSKIWNEILPARHIHMLMLHLSGANCERARDARGAAALQPSTKSQEL